MEEEDERGVAHIVEHLAFSATKIYTNHDIVKFLESIGAEFGACQNAMTSADETVYELFVPIDKPELLSQAISVLAEFSSEVYNYLIFVVWILFFCNVFLFLMFTYFISDLLCRFECLKMIWKKKEGLLWKSIEETEMPVEGCRTHIGL